MPVSDGKFIKIIVFDVFLDLFVIWDLGMIGVVKNLRTGSTNISSYRGGHPENLYFFIFF